MNQAISIAWLALLMTGCASAPSGQQPATSTSMAQPSTVQTTQITANPSVTVSTAGPSQGTSPTVQSAAQQPTVITQNGQAQTKGLADSQPKQSKLICSKDPMIGSHIQQRICLTPEQLAARKAASKTGTDNTLGVTGAAVPNGIFKRNDQPPY